MMERIQFYFAGHISTLYTVYVNSSCKLDSMDVNRLKPLGKAARVERDARD